MDTLPQQSFLDVDRIVGDIGVHTGQKVADLGCGSGFFTLAMAKVVGKEGVVTAVDVMQEPLGSVQARAEAAGFENVRTVRADLEVLGGTKIPDASQDVALIKNVLFQSQKKDAIVAEAARIVKPGGKVVVIDWKKGALGFGPPENLRVDESMIEQMGVGAGLKYDRALTLDQYHFGIIFTK